MPQVPDPDIRSNRLHLVLAANPVSVREGLMRMLAVPPLAGLPPQDRGTVELVLAEVLNNVAEHAYAGGAGTVAVTLAPVPAGISCLIVDHGAAMPEGSLPEGNLPDVPGAALADLPEGGFGWHLIRTLTQDLAYVRTGGVNQLGFTIPAGGRGQ
jgi:serine/threonine-protein kinase RsbW